MEEDNNKEEKKDNSALINIIMIIGTVLGVALAVVLFMLVPRLCVSGLQAVFKTEFSKLARSGIEQLLKLAVFVLYAGIKLVKETISPLMPMFSFSHRRGSSSSASVER